VTPRPHMRTPPYIQIFRAAADDRIQSKSFASHARVCEARVMCTCETQYALHIACLCIGSAFRTTSSVSKHTLDVEAGTTRPGFGSVCCMVAIVRIALLRPYTVVALIRRCRWRSLSTTT
jgi:hypothetical protein